jgi:hypothetical protein
VSARALAIVAALGAPANADEVESDPPATPTVVLGGYLETSYSVNFRLPSNRITNLRAFDNRDRTFTLSNVALDITGHKGPLSTHIVLQIGSTPSTYYLAEPTLGGTSSVNANDAQLWKYIQQAVLTYNAPRDIVIDAGLMLSPVGPEALAVKDNWNWSRSNLFFGLPFYHTGARISHALGGGWTGTLHVYNGWNSVVDNNVYPCVGASAAYQAGDVKAQLLYMGGIERPDGAPEGRAWRNLFDAYLTLAASDQVSLQAEADAGVEPNAFGTSSWAAGALYAKVDLGDDLFAAVRGDYFREWTAETATRIFWPTGWIAEGTATLAYQPTRNLSLRLEMRHDQAQTPVFFGGTVEGDGITTPYIANRRAQETITLGATAWF